MAACCRSDPIFVLQQPSHRSGWRARLWQVPRWWKRWKGQQRLRKWLIGWRRHLGNNSLDSQILSPPSTSPSCFPPSVFPSCAPQDSVERWRETEPSYLHLVIIRQTPAASSPCLLSSHALNSCLFWVPCSHSTLTNRNISFYFFGSAQLQVCRIKLKVSVGLS